jgi:hypothetical protein
VYDSAGSRISERSSAHADFFRVLRSLTSPGSSFTIRPNDGGIIDTSIPRKKFGDQKSNLLKLLEAVVIPEAFDITYVKDWDKYRGTMAPIHRSHPNWNDAAKRAPDEAKVGGGYTLFEKAVTILLAIGPDRFTNNRFIRRLRYYMDEVRTPGIEGARGYKLAKEQVDSLASYRCHLLLNACWRNEDFMDSTRNSRTTPFTKYITHHPYYMDNYLPLIMYLFEDPHPNADSLKKLTSILKQSLFAKTPVGEGVAFQYHGDSTQQFPHLSQPNVTSTMGNDVAYYAHVYPHILEALKGLADIGLGGLADCFSFGISAKVNRYTVRLWNDLSFIEAQAGYGRNSSASTHDKNVNVPEEVKNMANSDTYPILVDNYVKAFEWAVKRGKLMSWNEYLAVLPSFMTTKSAGFPRGESVDLVVKLRVGDRIITKTLKSRSKILAFLFDYKRHLGDFENMVVWEGPETRLSRQGPLSVGIRDVPVRDRRTIYIVPLTIFCLEVPLMALIYDYLAEPGDCVVGKHNGFIWHDHAAALLATSTPGLACLATDFSAMDQTEHMYNEGNAIRAAIRIVRRRFPHVLEKFGPYMDIFETEEIVLNYMYHVPISVGLVSELRPLRPGEKDSNAVKIMDSLGSGLLGTAARNSMTTISHSQALNERLRLLGVAVNELSCHALGDDHLSTYRVLNLTRDIIRTVVDTDADLAQAHGLEVNRLKSVFREWSTEFLKRLFAYGWGIPRYPQLQVFAGEFMRIGPKGIGWIRSRASFFEEAIARGGSHDMYMRLLMAEWAWSRIVKTREGYSGVVRRVDTSESIHLPFGALFLSGTRGGAGVNPWTLVGANTDTYLEWLFATDMEYREDVSAANYIMAVSSSNIKREMARTIVSEHQLQAGENYINKYVIDPERRNASIEAENRMRRYGIQPAQPLGNYAAEKIELGVAGDTAINLDADADAFYGMKVKVRMLDYEAKQSQLGVPDEWLRHIRIEEGPHVPYLLDEFPVAMHPECMDLGRTFGFGEAADPFTPDYVAIARLLRSDRKFRRDITAEHIVEILTKPSLLMHADRQFDQLVVMGLDGSVAMKVLEAMSRTWTKVMVASRANAMSFRSGLLAYFSLGRSTFDRLVRLHAEVPDVLEGQLYQLGMAHYLTNFFRYGKLVRSEVSGDSRTTSIMSGRFLSRTRLYNPLIEPVIPPPAHRFGPWSDHAGEVGEDQ